MTNVKLGNTTFIIADNDEFAVRFGQFLADYLRDKDNSQSGDAEVCARLMRSLLYVHNDRPEVMSQIIHHVDEVTTELPDPATDPRAYVMVAVYNESWDRNPDHQKGRLFAADDGCGASKVWFSDGDVKWIPTHHLRVLVCDHKNSHRHNFDGRLRCSDCNKLI